MSNCGAGEGTLRVFHGLVGATACTMLRPFVKEDEKGKWVIDDT